MRSPGSCRLCQCPLDVESVSGLCATCVRSTETSVAKPHSSAPPYPFPVPLISVDESADMQLDLTHGVHSDLPQAEPDPPVPRYVPLDATTVSEPNGSSTAGDNATLPPAPPGYDLLEVLGSGGMGDVYLAREHATERLVAMKFLRSSNNRSAIERFLIEVRALSSLCDPHILGILATDFMRADPFFTTERATGGSLGKWIETNGPLPAREAARVMAIIARATDVAHARGILHRDIKPSNILLFEVLRTEAAPLASDGKLSNWCPKLGDFGLAKRLDHDDGATMGSGPIGTPSFMPPEQISRKNGDVGPTADVYGLGATLFYLLTGKPPYGPGGQAEVIHNVLTGAVPKPRSLCPDVPRDLDGIVVKCLEKDPFDRYASAAALAKDLEAFLAGKKPVAPRHSIYRRGRRWVGRRRAALITGGLLVVLASGLVAAAVMMGQPRDPLEEMKRDLAAGRQVKLLGDTGLPRYSRFLLEPNSLGESAAGDGTCGFHAFNYALLELFPAPGIDHYRVTLEIRQLVARPMNASDTVETDYCGVYFGYATEDHPSGSNVHGLYAVTFKEYRSARPPGAPTDYHVFFHTFGFRQHPDKSIYSSSETFKGLPFTPLGRPGPWRRVSFEVSPDGITVHWFTPDGNPQVLAEFDANRSQQKFANLRKKNRLDTPEFPDWSPNLPFGIISFRSQVAVRNVFITPLHISQ